MKTLLLGFIAAIVLAGCVAVPYDPAPVGYYYGPPPPRVSFSYSYRGGDGYYHHR
jgi:hypothetical protein